MLEAAQRLLKGERNVNSGLNVAALMILALSTICCGKDDLAKGYMIAGIRMAEDLCLLGEGRMHAEQFGSLSDDALSMLSHNAWGAFNFSA